MAEFGARNEELQLPDQPVLGLDLDPASGGFIDCGDLWPVPFEFEPVTAQIRDTIDRIFPNPILASERLRFIEAIDPVLFGTDPEFAAVIAEQRAIPQLEDRPVVAACGGGQFGEKRRRSTGP